MQTLINEWSKLVVGTNLPSIKQIKTLAKQIPGFKSFRCEVLIPHNINEGELQWVSENSKSFKDYADLPYKERIVLRFAKYDFLDSPLYTLVTSLYLTRCFCLSDDLIPYYHIDSKATSKYATITIAIPYIHRGS